jgi:hypothetical protein
MAVVFAQGTARPGSSRSLSRPESRTDRGSGSGIGHRIGDRDSGFATPCSLALATPAYVATGMRIAYGWRGQLDCVRQEQAGCNVGDFAAP